MSWGLRHRRRLCQHVQMKLQRITGVSYPTATIDAWTTEVLIDKEIFPLLIEQHPHSTKSILRRADFYAHGIILLLKRKDKKPETVKMWKTRRELRTELRSSVRNFRIAQK